MAIVTLRRLGFVSLFAAVSLVGGGGPADADMAAKTTKTTCDLLTAAETEQVVGQPVGQPKKSKLRSNICQWQVGSDPSDHVSVLLQRGAQAQGAFQAANDPGLYELSEIEGLGQDAFFAPSIKTVWVLKESQGGLLCSGSLSRRDAESTRGTRQGGPGSRVARYNAYVVERAGARNERDERRLITRAKPALLG
jgi:hypothetical protein